MRVLVLIALVALALAGCSSLSRAGSNCRPHGGLLHTRVQSVNAALFICRDGTVFRYDTGNG